MNVLKILKIQLAIMLLFSMGMRECWAETDNTLVTIVRPEIEVAPEDGPVLRSIETGDRVVLVSYRDVLEPHVLRVDEDKKHVVESKTHPNHPACQFLVRKDSENFLHFISEYASDEDEEKALFAADDGTYNVGLVKDEGLLTQQWALDHDQDLEKWFGQIIRLTSRATGARLAVPSETMKKQHAKRVTTAIAPGKPAGDERESRLKVVFANDLIDKIIVGGSKTFNYHEKIHSWFNPMFSKKWKSSSVGSVALSFNAESKGVVAVAITSAPVRALGGMYYIRFGVIDEDTGEEQIVISKDVIGSTLHRINYAKKEKDSYWVTVNNGVIKIGTGKKIGENQVGFYSDVNPLKTVQYVGLGGISDAVNYSEITITSDLTTQVDGELYLPAGFTEESGPKMKAIASGSRKGKIEAWGLSLDGNLYYWEVEGVVSGWRLHTPRTSDDEVLEGVHDLALSSGGILCCLSRGKAYEYNWSSDRWIQLKLGSGNEQLRFDQIAVGNRENIWASDAQHTTVYQHSSTGWKEKADACIAVSCGYDGTVVVLNDAGEPYIYDPSAQENDSWIDISVGQSIVPESEIPGFSETTDKNIQLESLAVVNSEDMYGITKDLKMVRYTGLEWRWVVGTNVKEPFDLGIARGFFQVQANAAGTLFAVTPKGSVYKRGGRGAEQKLALKKAKEEVGIEDKDNVTSGTLIAKREPLYKKLKMREREGNRGRGVTRRGRRSRAQEVVRDVRVKRLNRSNLGDKVIKTLKKNAASKISTAKKLRFGGKTTGLSRTRSEKAKSKAAIDQAGTEEDRTRGRAIISTADMRMLERRLSGRESISQGSRESRIKGARQHRREKAED